MRLSNLSKYPESEYDNTHNMNTRQQNEAKYPKYEYSNTHNTSMPGKLIRNQAEQIHELKERDTAKAPKEVSEEYGYFECPSCGKAIYASDNFESHKFCLNCGQRLKWEE
ncbi:hypothetical protein H9X90_05450 [Faecalicatena contorta]|uniref:hypothetical protein n=1 Tax=Faecalicatena contorta TaxID=39482 RepID=UPI001961A0BA|nr:hypothetical protein [Faecalicatena contorta]MBM6685448.1 hypothetical protein [Faecalicatena contorta]MBM6710190.1 hypothetical protein [Faecalicatena contorta]